MRLNELKAFGTYVAVVPTWETQANLEAWARANDIDLDPHLHVTILYSRVVGDIAPSDLEHQAKPLTMGSLGTVALAVNLYSPSIVGRHDELMKLGHTHDYDPYMPHMTLKSKGPIPTELTPIPFDLHFENEYSEPLTD